MLNCILIDDDEDEIEIFTMALAELDFEVDFKGFTDCKTALDELSSQNIHPDCIFLDSNLSGIDGRECLTKMKTISGLAEIPVVIFSGLISDAEKSQYADLGAFECITKANTLKDLQDKLNTFFTANFRQQC